MASTGYQNYTKDFVGIEGRYTGGVSYVSSDEQLYNQTWSKGYELGYTGGTVYNVSESFISGPRDLTFETGAHYNKDFAKAYGAIFAESYSKVYGAYLGTYVKAAEYSSSFIRTAGFDGAYAKAWDSSAASYV